MAFLVRAPASRTGNPGSRLARCDGADPGGLHQHKAGATGLFESLISYVACSLFFKDINQHKKRMDLHCKKIKKIKKTFSFIIDNIVVSFNNHCLPCSD